MSSYREAPAPIVWRYVGDGYGPGADDPRSEQTHQPKGHQVINLSNLSWATVRSFLRQAAAVWGMVVAVSGSLPHEPANIRGWIAAVSGAILTAEHYANATNPSTPPNSNPPTP